MIITLTINQKKIDFYLLKYGSNYHIRCLI
jgi:hypothetical protein